MAEKREWHYSKDGEQFGPMTASELASLGSLSPDDLVWKDGMDDWVTAGSIKELTAKTNPAKPAPPPLPSSKSKLKRDAPSNQSSAKETTAESNKNDRCPGNEKDQSAEALFTLGKFVVTKNSIELPNMWGSRKRFSNSEVQYLELVPKGMHPKMSKWWLVGCLLSVMGPGLLAFSYWLLVQRSGWFAHIIVHGDGEPLFSHMLPRIKADAFVEAFNRNRGES